MDSTSTWKKDYIQHKTDAGFTIVPRKLFDLILGSSLPLPAKFMVLLVFRFSAGYQNQWMIISQAELLKLLPINHNNLEPMIKGLIKLNILKGGICKDWKNGLPKKYKLAVNLQFHTWDIGYPSICKNIIDELHEQCYKTRAAVSGKTGSDKRNTG